MAVVGVAVVREARSGRAFIASDDSVRDAVDGAPGRGLYDPPPGDKRNYCSLYCEGGITLVFPTTIGAGGGGFLSLDWVAGRMRYQVREHLTYLPHLPLTPYHRQRTSRQTSSHLPTSSHSPLTSFRVHVFCAGRPQVQATRRLSLLP